MSKLAHSCDETMAKIEAAARKRDERACNDDPDAIDNCTHCGCKPEDVSRCCTTGAGSDGRPCDGEAP